MCRENDSHCSPRRVPLNCDERASVTVVQDRVEVTTRDVHDLDPTKSFRTVEQNWLVSRCENRAGRRTRTGNACTCSASASRRNPTTYWTSADGDIRRAVVVHRSHTAEYSLTRAVVAASRRLLSRLADPSRGATSTPVHRRARGRESTALPRTRVRLHPYYCN
jgi:hypothetical protein